MKADISSAKNIWGALQKFQEINEPVQKDGNNPHFGSKYATLENVINSIKEPCKKSGICYQQWADGNEIHTRVFLLNNPGDYIEQSLEMVLDANPQRMGSAITYYRRYSLGLIFNLQFDDDDGNAAAGLPPRPAANRSAPNRQPAPKDGLQIKKIMGDVIFNQMIADFKKCISSADMKKIAAYYKTRYEMKANQIDEANAAFSKRFNYLKQCNK